MREVFVTNQKLFTKTLNALVVIRVEVKTDLPSLTHQSCEHTFKLHLGEFGSCDISIAKVYTAKTSVLF